MAGKTRWEAHVTISLGLQPPYCRMHPGRQLTPSQWTTCWKYGWDEPTNLMGRLGHDFGHNVFPVLVILAIIILFLVRVLIRGTSGLGATPK